MTEQETKKLLTAAVCATDEEFNTAVKDVQTPPPEHLLEIIMELLYAFVDLSDTSVEKLMELGKRAEPVAMAMFVLRHAGYTTSEPNTRH